MPTTKRRHILDLNDWTAEELRSIVHAVHD